MSVTLVSAPQANIQDNAANKSYWTAVHHPVTWTLQRKDFIAYGLIGAGDPTSFVRFSSGAPTPTQLAEAVVGDYIYFASGTGSIAQAFLIVSIGANYLEINYVYTGTLAGGFVNYTSARKNYFIETAVLEIDTAYGAIVIGSVKSTCSPSGLATVNTMEYLKSLVNYYESFGFNQKRFRDATLGGLSSIKYRESYNTTVTAYEGLQYLGLGSYTNSAKQVKDIYGVNMADYVTSLLYTGAKFMSDFETPTYFAELPFALTCILSEHLYPTPDSSDPTITGLLVNEYQRNVNGTLIGTSTLSIFNAADVAGVYRIMLLADASIAAATNTIDVWLTANGATNITEIKTVKYNNVCKYKNPIYLNWLGTNGGRNFWLFDTNQTEVLEVTSTGDFTPQTVNLETDLGNGEYLGKNATPELVCTAYLELSDITGLKGLLMSPDVLMLTNPDTWDEAMGAGALWKRVKVLPQTYKVLETNATHAEIEITLQLPTINIQTQ